MGRGPKPQNQNHKTKTPVNRLDSQGSLECEGEDSNLHGSYPASTSSQCVSQKAAFSENWGPLNRAENRSLTPGSGDRPQFPECELDPDTLWGIDAIRRAEVAA